MKKRVIAVGFFDGLHLGHKALVCKAKEIAREKNLISAVFTFTKHPDEVIFGEKVSFLFNEEYREEEILRIGGVDEVLFWEFDKQNASMDWDLFVKEILIDKFCAAHIVTGEDFRFGAKGAGNAEKLCSFCKEHGVGYTAIKQVLVDNVRVSSTKVREFLSVGDIKNANKFLGHPVTISGIVENGRQDGRKIGFNTANIKMPKSMQKLPNGVYATKTIVDGKEYQSITNIGVIPTFLDQNDIKVESHILDFSDDIYGKLIQILVFEFIRPEQKFADIGALKNQISEDIEKTREIFREAKLC